MLFIGEMLINIHGMTPVSSLHYGMIHLGGYSCVICYAQLSALWESVQTEQ